MTDYYQTLFKRKSFHLFRNTGSEMLSPDELNEIEDTFRSFRPLYPELRTAIRIVPSESVNFNRGAEYCILLYSEPKENYLMNAGYLGEQLDLYLVSKNIGTLWYGIGEADMPSMDGLDFVVMIAIRKIRDDTLFRKNMFKAKRKALDEIWVGNTLGVAEIARFAPSSCNTQPWYVESTDEALTVYRYKKPGKRGIMPKDKVIFYNRIDIGIFLFVLETCLLHEGISFNVVTYPDTAPEEEELVKVAAYYLN